jgi:GNAT superfamily N-acetyltransferase
LRSEYSAAFFYYDIPTALKKIDDFIRKNMYNESDREEWCNYIYSLADFMWKKGILTDDVRNKTIEMIDNDFGLELWEEAGDKTLSERKRKLSEFKTKLLSPMSAQKKIKPNTHTERIFKDGDLIAVQLQTKGKPYTSKSEKEISDEEFSSYDGKYVLMQLIKCYASWSSYIVPEVKDYWANFTLFDGVYDSVPKDANIFELKTAHIHERYSITSQFNCESSMHYFKRRNYVVIGSFPEQIKDYSIKGDAFIFWSINREWLNPDSQILAAMGKDTACDEYMGSVEGLRDIYLHANRFGRFDNHLSREENENKYLLEEDAISCRLNDVKAQGGTLLKISFGRMIGFISVMGNQIDNLYIEGVYQRNGFGTELLRYALSYVGNDAYIDVPSTNIVLLHICEKLGMQKTSEGTTTFISLRKR